jgi:hypothetical protein
MALTTTTTTVHVLAPSTVPIDKGQIEAKAVRVRDAATSSHRWKTLAKLDLLKGASRLTTTTDNPRPFPLLPLP